MTQRDTRCVMRRGALRLHAGRAMRRIDGDIRAAALGGKRRVEAQRVDVQRIEGQHLLAAIERALGASLDVRRLPFAEQPLDLLLHGNRTRAVAALLS